MIIRSQQMATFGDASGTSYENRTVVHLRKCFPEQCQKLDENRIRQLITLGIERAQRYGIVTERDVCLYIDLMFMFGEDYDTSPKLPWASEILNDPHRTDPSRKIDYLYDVALGHVKEQSRWEEVRI
jgi:hypothetical protein